MNETSVPCACCGIMTPVAEAVSLTVERLSPVCLECLQDLVPEGPKCDD